MKAAGLLVRFMKRSRRNMPGAGYDLILAIYFPWGMLHHHFKALTRRIAALVMGDRDGPCFADWLSDFNFCWHVLVY
jgi:hypothetical protein